MKNCIAELRLTLLTVKTKKNKKTELTVVWNFSETEIEFGLWFGSLLSHEKKTWNSNQNQNCKVKFRL